MKIPPTPPTGIPAYQTSHPVWRAFPDSDLYLESENENFDGSPPPGYGVFFLLWKILIHQPEETVLLLIDVLQHNLCNLPQCCL